VRHRLVRTTVTVVDIVMALGLLTVALVTVAPPPAAAAAQPVDMAAPYEYLGWGDPPSPTAVMAATGVQDLTLAFILSHGNCTPAWDGTRPLLGGSDQAAIAAIRAAGGDVDVSFGGWSGKKLGSSCQTATALAAAYQTVITDYSLKAIDIDIEHKEISNARTRTRVIAALALVQRANPGLDISVTFGCDENGPNRQDLSLIDDAAAIGFQPTAWTIMPFDFEAPVSDMGSVSIAAAVGLDKVLAATYHESEAAAYGQIGISSMNGQTDEADETVSVANFQDMLDFAQANHLARLTFWAVNRDRPCAGADTTADSCSGISQQPDDFTTMVAQFHG
jgi:chitinase